MEIALTLEGQDGLNWERWKRFTAVAEEAGFAGVFRSDHFCNPTPPDKDSLELWVSLTWLASHSQKLVFGPVVTPMSFRDPALTARMAGAVQDLSGGRLVLGLGAGWQVREHDTFGYDLLDTDSRFRRFEEGLEVIIRLLRSDQPVTFEGKYYQLRDAVVWPRPATRIPILIGGNGERRTLPLAARFADEWNGMSIPPARFKELSVKLDALLHAAGRSPEAMKRSLMQSVICAPTPAEVETRLAARGQSRAVLAAKGVVIGTLDQIPAQLEAYRRAGVQRLMLRWLELDDMHGLKALGQVVCAQT